MEINSIMTIISTVGFPIFACVAMAIYVNKLTGELRATIENNTKVMIKICAKLNIDDEEKL